MIEIQSLTKRYGPFTALDDCTFSVARGEILGLLGPNGAGKTTLLRLLLGFLRASAGEARIDGLDCYRQSHEAHKRLSYLPGEAKLFRQMRGRQIIDFFVLARGGGRAARARMLALADRLSLDLTRQVAKMSTGMRQKLALAITLAADAPLLILDEPTSTLDPTVRGEVLRLVAELRAEGRTVLFSSHVLGEVEQSCDRVAVLRAGRLAHIQTMSELRRKHRIRARLTGPMPATPATIGVGLSITQRDDGQIEFETPGELAPLLGWLATFPLAEIQIEPVGLLSVYERYHPPQERGS